MKCLFIHPGHDGSITIVVDKKIIVHHQIDRFNRLKHSALPSHALLHRIQKLNIVFDLIYITFLDEDNCTLIWLKFLKQYNLIKEAKIEYSMQHHKYHAYTTLFTTGAKDVFVFDRAGANLNNQVEQESFYKDMKLLHTNFKSSTYKGLGWQYTDVTEKLGFGEHGDAKTMAYADHNQQAEEAQNKFEKDSFKLITSVFKDEVGLGGGCTQNVLNNTKLNNYLKVKACPFNGDFGISLGAANAYFNNTLESFQNINMGFDLEYNHGFKIHSVFPEEVARILQKDVVAIMQGPSEQGQRGLGFRSLLANPLDPKCKDKINAIKKREWFRPFACSILHEHGENYLEDYFYSPYMMYVFKCKSQDMVNVCSKSNTTRAQSVKEGHYYDLMKSFYNITNCPFVLNTSLNLPGHVLVETFDDLRYMLTQVPLKYVYLPEIKKIIINENR
jgi:predicted NodU family carbamoyl transferase